MLVKNPVVVNGIIDHPTKLKKNVKIGAKIKLNVLAFVGITVSLRSNYESPVVLM